ncbi:MAG: hypothetical protein QNJ46_29185 [Leptolyngbyaceae cyanobacterium MO_188.B28]|nr:hypothetical protein [Leptolyngbyaceae cyanobacterium MO_188.B28]
MRVLFALAGLSLGFVSTRVALAESPNAYLGAGIRAGFNDDVGALIDSKVKVFPLGDALSISVRPELLLGNDTELRLPISLDAEIDQGVYPFAGVGVAYNADGSSDFDPMATAGLDLGLNSHWVLSTELNVIFKSGDTDTEFIGSLNYAF